jgi:Tfp pilus assembly protein PilN
MKDIDFLPAKYREANAQRRVQLWRMAVLACFAALLCAAAIGEYEVQRSTKHELEQVCTHYDLALADSQRLANLEQARDACRAEADLLTFLRHPWPRTRILAQLVAPLPDTIIFTRLQIERQRTTGKSAAPMTMIPQDPAVAAAALARLSPAQRDLRRLREEIDGSQTVVILEGTTRENTALHSYLGKLAAAPMFSAAELTSIESLEKEQPGASRFSARLVVRPGYGQRGGPTRSTSTQAARTTAAQERSR